FASRSGPARRWRPPSTSSTGRPCGCSTGRPGTRWRRSCGPCWSSPWPGRRRGCWRSSSWSRAGRDRRFSSNWRWRRSAPWAVCALGLWLALPGGPLAYAWFIAAGNAAVLAALAATLIAFRVLRVRDLLAAASPLLVLAGVAGAALWSGFAAEWDAARSLPAFALEMTVALLLGAGAARLLDPAGLGDALAFAPGGARLARGLGLGHAAPGAAAAGAGA